MEANKPCRQSYSCKFPFCKFIHPCRYGVLCRKSMGSDPLHFSKYSHPKPCPSGADCKIDDHVHIWEFSHVCKYHINGGCKKMDDNFHTRRFIHPKPPLLRQTFPINSHTYFEEQGDEEDDEEEEEIVNDVESENEDEDENENESENFLEGENEDSSLFDVPITDVLLTRSTSSATSNLSSPQNLPRRHLFFDDDDEGVTISPLSTRSPSPTPNAFRSSSTSSSRRLIFTDESEGGVIDVKTPTSTSNSSGDKSSQGQSTESFRECKICLDNDIEVALVPCGHALACVSCAKCLKKCPMCCALFTTTIRIFLS